MNFYQTVNFFNKNIFRFGNTVPCFSCFKISSIFLWFVKNSVTPSANCIQANLLLTSLLNDVESGDDHTVGDRDIGNI